jgi:hypothetical protein
MLNNGLLRSSGLHSRFTAPTLVYKGTAERLWTNPHHSESRSKSQSSYHRTNTMAPIGSLWGDIVQRQTKVVSRGRPFPPGVSQPFKQILSVAALNGLELVLAVPEFKFSDKPKEFLTKFPYGKIPTFEHSEGWTLSEGASIARYRKQIS